MRCLLLDVSPLRSHGPSNWIHYAHLPHSKVRRERELIITKQIVGLLFNLKSESLNHSCPLCCWRSLLILLIWVLNNRHNLHTHSQCVRIKTFITNLGSSSRMKKCSTKLRLIILYRPGDKININNHEVFNNVTKSSKNKFPDRNHAKPQVEQDNLSWPRICI